MFGNKTLVFANVELSSIKVLSNFDWTRSRIKGDENATFVVPNRGFLALTFRQSDSLNITTVNGTTFLAYFDGPNNVFHFSAKVMVYLNLMLSGVLLNHTILVRHLIPWEMMLSEMLFSSTTSKDLLKGLRGNQVVCFQEVYIPGQSLPLFQGLQHAIAFRKLSHQYLHLRPVCRNISITFVNRRARRVLNHNVLIEAIQALGYPFTYVDDWYDLPPIQQALLMSTTRVFIAVHGAGLTNMIFMATGGVVVELFPPRFSYELYERVAVASGLRHVAYIASECANLASDGWGPYSNASNSLCSSTYSCRSIAKRCNFHVETQLVLEQVKFAVGIVDNGLCL